MAEVVADMTISVDRFVNDRSASVASKKHCYNSIEEEISLKTSNSKFKI